MQINDLYVTQEDISLIVFPASTLSCNFSFLAVNKYLKV